MCDTDTLCKIDNFEFDEETTVQESVRGRLRRSYEFWRSIGASSMILKIINNGYFLPFIREPRVATFKNHRSALQNSEFVMDAVQDLLKVGSIEEVSENDIIICSPLGVVPKKNKKLRLILDLRYLNDHLCVKKFKYEDLLIVSQIVSKGDWFISFDLKNGYHHIDIAQAHRKYLGFCFPINGCTRYFVFASLPFGLSTAPYIFTKVLRPLVKHWRSQGKRMVMYLDDGFVCASSQQAASQLAEIIKNDLTQSGLMINTEKSDLNPHQVGEFLGFTVDLQQGIFSVPQAKVSNLMTLLYNIKVNRHCVSAREVARATGIIISMSLALGPVARLFTRSLYASQNSVPSLSFKICLSEESLNEVQFWIDNFSDLVGQPMWYSSPCIDVISYSDASSTGWGGYAVQLGQLVARGDWDEGDRRQSSTYRELKAVRLVLESLAQFLSSKECKHRSDNQGTVAILCSGSNKKHLQSEATKIYAICRRHGIRLHAEWIPRHLNQRADYWSRVIETDDWMLNPAYFRMLDAIWGPHTVDRFASLNSKQLPRFCSKWLCPGCEGVDAFTLSWNGENNWLVPPVYLISRVIRHMIHNGESGTLVVPHWPSAPWWPLLFRDDGPVQDFVVGFMDIPVNDQTFLPGSAESDLFGHGVPSCRILALRIVCQ